MLLIFVTLATTLCKILLNFHFRFLVKQLTGARTLPANFYSKLNDSLVSRFSIGSVMEVVDKNRISQVKVCT